MQKARVSSYSKQRDNRPTKKGTEDPYETVENRLLNIICTARATTRRPVRQTQGCCT